MGCCAWCVANGVKERASGREGEAASRGTLVLTDLLGTRWPKGHGCGRGRDLGRFGRGDA